MSTVSILVVIVRSKRKKTESSMQTTGKRVNNGFKTVCVWLAGTDGVH